MSSSDLERAGKRRTASLVATDGVASGADSTRAASEIMARMSRRRPSV